MESTVHTSNQPAAPAAPAAIDMKGHVAGASGPRLQVTVHGNGAVDWDVERLVRSLQESHGLNEDEARAVSADVEKDLRCTTPQCVPGQLIESLTEAKLMTRNGMKLALAAPAPMPADAPPDSRRDDEQLEISENSLRVLERRYLRKNAEGEPIETPPQLFWRVANNIAQGDMPYSPERVHLTAKDFHDMMARLEFLPNSPTLMNAGADLQQLSACFVLPVGDSMEEIFDTVKHAALIHKTGGGTGFAFSRLRPAGSIVRTTGGVASGPVSFMKVINSATEAVKQGGTRRGANMGILRVDHPDIIDFITCKNDTREVTNFNISAAITERFMQAVENDEEYDLIDPRTKQVTDRLNARKVFNIVVLQAWQNGDPGIVFLDRINVDNPTPQLGDMESTNPCGEQPLLPYESCNLGSINLSRMLIHDEDGWRIDYGKLCTTIGHSIHFLDNVIEMNNYPLEEIEAITRSCRRVGLGVMGFADMLLRLEIPYDSPEAVALGEQVMNFIEDAARDASRQLIHTRGPFEMFEGSLWDKRGDPPQRNSTVTTIAPTGTISIIANCSSGIEPLFALAYFRNVMDNDNLIEVNPIFEEVAKQRGFYSDALMEKVIEHGSCRGIDEVPEDVQRVFVTSHDISPEWHVRMQAAFQTHTDNAVSKTVNFSNDATVEDVAKVYMLAYKLGCKGVTIYRDGSRDAQVLNLGKPQEKTAATAGAAPATAQGEPVAHGAAEVLPPKGIDENGYAELRPRSRRLRGDTERIATADGDLYITINKDEFGIAEVFLQLGKSGSLVNSLTEALGRIISISLRSGVDPHVLVRQLLGIQCGRQVWFEGELIQSVPDAIGKALGHHLNMTITEARPAPEQTEKVNFLKPGPNANECLNVCPDCSHVLEPLEGCLVCRSCGYSECY